MTEIVVINGSSALGRGMTKHFVRSALTKELKFIDLFPDRKSVSVLDTELQEKDNLVMKK